MKRTTLVGMLSVLTILVLGAGVLLAQRDRVLVRPNSRAMILTAEDGRARLGVRLTDVTAEKMQELKLSGESGAIVTEVEKDSAAAKAGLETNDVIQEFDGERVRSVAQMRRLVQDTPPGRTVAVKVSRAGQIRTFNVKLEAVQSAHEFREFNMPEVEIPDIHMPEMNFGFFNEGPRLGISADDLTPQLAAHLGVAQGKGVLVLEVNEGSAAEKAGLKAGDCIVKVGNDPVESVSDLHRALGHTSNSEEKQSVTLTIVRDKHEQTLSVQLEPAHPRTITIPRRIARNDLIGFDPSELLQSQAELQSSMSELRASQKELESQRRDLIQEQQRMMKELRRELNKQTMGTSI
jgi:predicted metalloprotease with PDZ domain